MKIAIRTDASIEIGSGHIMRCLSLAKKLREKGAQVRFVCREHEGHLLHTVAAQGFSVHGLDSRQRDKQTQQAESGYKKHSKDTPHQHWLGTSWQRDARQTIQTLREKAPWDWLIVDHYALDAKWENLLRLCALRILVIDDLADREHDCDLLLDQNYFHNPGRRYHGLLPQECKTLLGPKYALLRPEFLQAPQYTRMRGNGIARILVYFGSSDPDNLTERTLEGLNYPEIKGIPVEVVAGSNNRHLDNLRRWALMRPATRVHHQPENFIELLLRADLCIGAGGTTTWERLCLGLPSIVITIATNQETSISDLDNDGYVTWLGGKDEVSPSDIRDAVVKKMTATNVDDSFFDSLQDLVDGMGAKRVEDRLIASFEESTA